MRINQTIARLCLTVLSLAILFSVVEVRTQTTNSDSQRDELLISIPSSQIKQAVQSVSTPLRFYQRFAEMMWRDQASVHFASS